MASDVGIKRYSATELEESLARGGDRSDWARINAMTEDQLEASIAEDPDWKDIPSDWYVNAMAWTPPQKKLLSLRIDQDIIDWFKQQGPGYQTRMNAVLRAYMTAAGQGKDKGKG